MTKSTCCLLRIATQPKRVVICTSFYMQLPDKQRLPIIHVKLQGLSVAEAAKVTGMSASAIKVGIHRGLKALAAKIRSEN